MPHQGGEDKTGIKEAPSEAERFLLSGQRSMVLEVLIAAG